jgi:non-homologous end joining protein Ku
MPRENRCQIAELFASCPCLLLRVDLPWGYEFAKEQFVIFSPEELEELEDASSQTIDIGELVPLESVDPVYFACTYYLAPDKGGSKPYALFVTALEKSNRVPWVVILRAAKNTTRLAVLDLRIHRANRSPPLAAPPSAPHTFES